jgi:hypothetical protein
MTSVYKIRRFGCETCGAHREHLSWDYDPAPVCCDQAMQEGAMSRHTLQIITDNVPGGFVVENGFSKPTRFDSKSEHRRALSAKGFKLAEKGECGF